jgi:hypothetical protein
MRTLWTDTFDLDRESLSSAHLLRPSELSSTLERPVVHPWLTVCHEGSWYKIEHSSRTVQRQMSVREINRAIILRCNLEKMDCEDRI